MKKNEIAEVVAKILITELGHNNFEMNDELVATHVHGWDSLTHMIIITAIESQFNIKFRLKELNKLKNMGTLLELIKEKL